MPANRLSGVRKAAVLQAIQAAGADGITLRAIAAQLGCSLYIVQMCASFHRKAGKAEFTREAPPRWAAAGSGMLDAAKKRIHRRRIERDRAKRLREGHRIRESRDEPPTFTHRVIPSHLSYLWEPLRPRGPASVWEFANYLCSKD